MSTEIADFIVKLASDPGLLSQFENNPAKILAEKGFSSREADIIMSRDSEAVRTLLAVSKPRMIDSKAKKKKKKTTKKSKSS
jgi:hypothetical protein